MIKIMIKRKAPRAKEAELGFPRRLGEVGFKPPPEGAAGQD